MKLAYPIATPEVRASILGVKGPLVETLRGLAELGYDAIEPFVSDPEKFDVEAWTGAVQRSGLAVVAVGTGPLVFDDQLSFTSPDENIRRMAIQRAKSCVRFAARLGAQLNIGKLRGNIDAAQPAISWRWMKEALNAVCAEATDHRIDVTLEPQSRGIINNLNSTAAALGFIGELGLPNCRLMLDTFHMAEEREDISAGFRAAAERQSLLHVHFADTARRVPGDGTIDFAAAVATLRALGYDRAITVEIKQEPDAWSAARRAAQQLCPLLSS